MEVKFTVDGVEYNLSKKLKSLKTLERSFGMSYLKIFDSISNFTLDKQLQVIYCIVEPDELNGLSKTEFLELVYNADDVAMGTVVNVLTKYIQAIQYPDKTEEEIAELTKKQ